MSRLWVAEKIPTEMTVITNGGSSYAHIERRSNSRQAPQANPLPHSMYLPKVLAARRTSIAPGLAAMGLTSVLPLRRMSIGGRIASCGLQESDGLHRRGRARRRRPRSIAKRGSRLTGSQDGCTHGRLPMEVSIIV